MMTDTQKNILSAINQIMLEQRREYVTRKELFSFRKMAKYEPTNIDRRIRELVEMGKLTSSGCGSYWLNKIVSERDTSIMDFMAVQHE